MIVIWKSPRAKTRIRKGIEESNKTVRDITTEIAQAKTPEQRLDILTSVFGIGIPIASAILTICYPNDFTITDYRVRESLKELGYKISDPTASVKAYLDYLDLCKKLSHEQGLSLRDFDRALWGRDFYEGSGGLRQLIRGLD